MNNPIFSWAQWALLSVYLVILAGAIVRMTGSGMGCPDWPKCFGYLIPPTERSQLDWKPENTYEKGNVIIYENTLQVAAKDFKSRTSGSSSGEHTFVLFGGAPHSVATDTKHEMKFRIPRQFLLDV